MQLRNVGTSGLKVSTLGLGCNNFGGRLDEAASIDVIHAALDHGVTHFDTADIYPMGAGGASEEILGKGLGTRRADVVLATKFGMKMSETAHGASRRYIMTAVEDSLSRLNTDWIDLLYLHHPDPDTPIEETLRALDDLIHAGKVRYIGCSNFAAWQIAEAHFLARELGTHQFICSQEEYSLVARKVEAEVIPACTHLGLSLIPFFPLASGVLTGKYRKGEALPEGSRLSKTPVHVDLFLTDANLTLVEKLSELAKAAGLEMIDLAFGWLLANSAVPSVIAGASSPEQVARNAQAVAEPLPRGVVDQINALLQGDSA